MRVIILSGFLGSGKTSLLLQLAHYVGAGDAGDGRTHLAIIENEVGSVSVDDQVLAGGGYEMRTLFAGCVCCTLMGELTSSVQQIADDLDPEYLVIEPSGVASPISIAESLQRYVGVSARIVGIGDAQRWSRVARAMPNLLKEQLVQADVLLLNKVDLAEPAAVDEIEQAMRDMNPRAPLFRICANQPLDEEVLAAVSGKGADDDR